MKVPYKKYKKGAFVLLSGRDPSRSFFIIKSGQVMIKKNNPVLGNIEEVRTVGFIFGIIQCVTGINEDITAQAITDCEVFVINRDEIKQLQCYQSLCIFSRHPY